MATTLSADKLAQRAVDVNVLTPADLQTVWSELGTENVDVEQFKQVCVRRGLLTNFQIDRLVEGYRTGFFYGDYKVQYCVGAGTFARVFRAAHRVTNELFAVKVLRSRFSKAGTEDHRELFRREGELGAQLKHPNIVAIHEVGAQGLASYIVMDFVEGQNLRDFWKLRGKFEHLEATRIAADMLAGLNYAFQQGITHRDLKMSNVIVSSDGEAKLLDFGLAGMDAESGEDATNPRTIDYAGLERATNVRKDDTRSDIFFAGCIYYQLMSGKPALPETRERSQRLAKGRYQEIKPIIELVPKLPLVLARIVTKATEFEPDKRYQTPGEMLADLKLAQKRIAQSKGDVIAAVDATPLEGHGDDGEPRKLMVVESDHKMQDLFRDLFKKQGYRVLVMSDPERGLQRIHDDARAADVILLSSGTLGRTAVDVFNRMGTEKRTVTMPAVLLLGEQHAAWAAEAPASGPRVVAQMPMKSRELRQCILEALAAGK